MRKRTERLKIRISHNKVDRFRVRDKAGGGDDHDDDDGRWTKRKREKKWLRTRRMHKLPLIPWIHCTHTHVHSSSDLIFPLCSRAHNFPSFSVSNGAELRSLLLLNLILLLICFARVSSLSFFDLLSLVYCSNVCSCKTEELCTTIATCASLVWYSVQDREDHRCHPLVNETATLICL